LIPSDKKRSYGVMEIGDTLPKIFREQVKRYKDRIALREKDLGIWNQISWNQYYIHVKNFCLGLISLGLESGDNVAILSENCPEWLYADLAIECGGGRTVGVYPTSPASQVKYIVHHSESKFIIVEDQEQTDKILEVKNNLLTLKKIIVIDVKGLSYYEEPLIISFKDVEELGGKYSLENPELFERLIDETRSDQIATIIYTSGTTGFPKGAMISHYNILSMIPNVIKALDFKEGDELVSYLPLCHIAERCFSLHLPLWVGYTVNFAESIETIQNDLQEIQPTAFFGVPRIWEKMYNSVAVKIQDATFLKRFIFKQSFNIGKKYVEKVIIEGRSSLILKVLDYLVYICCFRNIKDKLGLKRGRIVLSGAAPISPEILKYFCAMKIKIQELFGMTEGTSILSVVRGNDKLKFGTVGKPVPGVEFKIAEDGEILYRSSGVFCGYLKDQNATNATVKEGWLYSGDLGEFDKDGYLKITDRKKDIIITSGGKNVSPIAIENRLKFSPYIKEAIVIGDKRKYLSALIEIEMDTLQNWAQKNNIPYTTFKSLAENPRVYELIKKEIEGANKDFNPVENIRKFYLLTKELDHDDDELTATMKVRRNIIEGKFKDIVEKIYKS